MSSINEFLIVVENDGHKLIQCATCDHHICPASENHKLYALMHEGPIQEAGPHVNPYHLHGDKFVFRQFYCPNCLTLLNTEVAQKGESIVWDVELELN